MTGWLLHTLHATPMAQPGLTKTLYALVFGVAVWGWVFGLTGAALRFLSNYSATRRYVADASYWIYLAHLPVVAAFQVWVAFENVIPAGNISVMTTLSAGVDELL